MTKSILLPSFLLFTSLALAQTNTFPPSGNVGIGTTSPLASLHVNGNLRTDNNVKLFASDEAWADGLVIVKPIGWSGIRFSRYDPAYGNYEGNWALGYTGLTGSDFSISNYYMGIQYNNLIHISSITRNVGIGTSNPTSKLSVNGTIRAKDIKVDNVNWPDFVFAQGYQLPGLHYTELYIKTYGHLPEIPSAALVAANGIDLGEMNGKLLKKIEELTLHLIEQNKMLQKVLSDNQIQQQEIEKLKQR